ncbi:methionyl-tRNA synthetase [Cryptotrichosporon argae]
MWTEFRKAPSVLEQTSKRKPFYATTPIFYVNASPHIGHLHSLVLTDVFTRFSALLHSDREAVMATGTDEHGLKIQQAAAARGVPEREFCDDVSERFRHLADQANVNYTDFIRTSEPRHHRAVEAFWAKLVASGDIYKGSHEGWYSVSDECFYSATQVTERDGKTVAIETGNEVVWEVEENWKFRLSNRREGLERWLSRPESVWPESHRRDLLRQAADMQDLSISRPTSRLHWGVPVPGDASQTIYVWVDALVNYITVAGYPGEMRAWPADVHVVGKDIVRFHALHWPALLLSAGLPPPTRVLAHAHWTMERSKMSKSRGNVVDPLAVMGAYSADAVRWFLMRHGGALPSDADYSADSMRKSYSELAGMVGNLANRVANKAILAKVLDWDDAERDARLDARLSHLATKVAKRVGRYEIARACEEIMDVVVEANRFFTIRQPWNPSVINSTSAVVYAYTALRLAATLAQPIMPTKAGELLDRLGVPAFERTYAHAHWDPAAPVDVAAIVGRLQAGKESAVGQLFPRVRDESTDGASVLANTTGRPGRSVKAAKT